MIDREVELLAVGAGPSNLALAVALEELAPDLAANSLPSSSVPRRSSWAAWIAAALGKEPGLIPQGPGDAAEPAE